MGKFRVERVLSVSHRLLIGRGKPARHNGDFSVEAEAIQCAGHLGPPIGLGSMADEW
jgi:hypothetical protein